jgi:hypothetical protein
MEPHPTPQLVVRGRGERVLDLKQLDDLLPVLR